MGQFRGVWAHQDSLKSAKIAGGVPHAEPAGSFSTGTIDSPADDEQVREAVRTALVTLTREVAESAAA